MDLDTKIAEQKLAMTTWFDGFGTGDIDHAYSRFVEDATWLGIGPDFTRREYQGRGAIVRYQSVWVHTIWTGRMLFSPINILGDGRTVSSEWTDEAVSAETGETYRNRGVNVFEFDDAVDGGLRVVRGRTYFDFGPLIGDSISRFNAKDPQASL
jgi:hypothetical protein